MASRWMAPKLVKMAKDRAKAMPGIMAADFINYLDAKPARDGLRKHFTASDLQKALRKHGPKAEAFGLSRDVGREGKQRRARSIKCYGDGRRTIGTSDTRESEYDHWKRGYDAAWPLYRAE